MQNNVKFHSTHGKRLVLVADDEMINREMLSMILQDAYEVIFAENGREALQKMRTHRETLSIVLLDLLMPEMTGLQLLEALKDDPDLHHIPVIVLTSDQDSEVRSLELGAADFIPKPYPQPGVILARIRRTIELFEDRMTIQTTERDPLTQLYNRDFFFYYAELFDQYHKDMEMDAMVINIYHFHIIGERFGSTYADALLKRVGLKIRSLVADSGGIVSRREEDTFLVYCPHGKDYREILEQVSAGVSAGEEESTPLRLRMGVYENADKSITIERRFGRAARALDSIRDNLSKSVEIYDKQLHDRELFEEQLVEDFYRALTEKQFRIFYQPKYDIRNEEPLLDSAEALIRWIHPEFGFIPPATFIPLFEGNGLIHEIDHYVWNAAAEQIREWKDRFGFSVPVSVNVSRVDLYYTNLPAVFRDILDRNGLHPEDLHLEMTESAYTEETNQISKTVSKLREMGFRIEMDDFGTGYSSLNVLSTLPIDTLKLDMQFVRTAFRQKKDTRMLEIIIDIADYLNVPVIAEGVETEEQLLALKDIGCDIVQGYYFSKPVPAQEFEVFLEKRKQQSAALPGDRKASVREMRSSAFANIARALSKDYFSIYYIDAETDDFFEYSSRDDYRTLNIEMSGDDFFGRTRVNVERTVYPEDREMLLTHFTKENILAELENNRSFTMTYRLLIDGTPTYVHLKANSMDDRNDKHIVIGISNIDEQIRYEQEHQLALRNANRDALTGVISKYAYLTMEQELDQQIADRTAEPFAIAFCDLNGLKQINDTFGHQAGDEYIREACREICRIFKHSPVYRIGGDEFVVLLRGGDYGIRAELNEKMLAVNRDTGSPRPVRIACGIADYLPDQDAAVADVFVRADMEMYRNKNYLKKIWDGDRS